MRLTSLHGGHSGAYCDHASGRLENIVLQAIEKGFSHYGLSEHMPRTREKDLYPEERQKNRTPEQLQNMARDFITEARRLQKHYRERIHLLVGLETELIDLSLIKDVLFFQEQLNPDYVVGSVHHVNEIPIDISQDYFEQAESLLGGTEAVFSAYYDLQYQLMRDIHPEVIGHFDLIRLFRPNFELTENLWNKIERNLDYAIAYGALFELNARAFKKQLHEPYPRLTIINKILEKGGKLTLGDDSHSPEEVGLGFNRLFLFCREHNINKFYGLEKTVQGNLEIMTFDRPDR